MTLGYRDREIDLSRYTTMGKKKKPKKERQKPEWPREKGATQW